MTHPLLIHYKNSIITILICGILGGIQALVFFPILHICMGWLVFDGILFSLLFAALSIPLWMIVQFVNTSHNSNFQKIVNTVTLSITSISLWLGVGLGILYSTLPETIFSQILPTIPIRALIGLLAYFVVIQWIQAIINKEKLENQFDEVIEFEEKNEELSMIEKLERITVKTGQKIQVIPIENILYIQAEGDYVMIYTNDGKHLKEQTMKYFETNLPKDSFVRIHRSCIVNIQTISSVQLFEKQNYMLTLRNGAVLKASNAGYKLLKLQLNL